MRRSGSARAAFQATSGTPDSVGLSLEVSLCSGLVSSHKDCDIAEYSWLRCVSEQMSLRDVPTQMPQPLDVES